MNEGEARYPEPRANPLFVGHEPAWVGLTEALRTGRMPHAWLITGPRGIGKATLAFRFARHVFAHVDENAAASSLFGCEATAAKDPTSEPEHPVFRRVAAGGHADLMTVERQYNAERKRTATDIVVADVRDVSRFLALTPAEGGWRIVIVDAAEDMNNNAANALLKILEEPPQRALLLLISHAAGRLPATVRSRCHRIALKPLADGQVGDLLARYRPDLPADDREALVSLAEGRIGRALGLADAGGLTVASEVAALMETLPEIDVVTLHAFGERVARDSGGSAFETVGDILRWWLARIIRVAATGSTPPTGPEQAVMTRLAAAGGLDRWLEVWEKTDGLLSRADAFNLDRKHVLLDVFLHMGNAARC